MKEEVHQENLREATVGAEKKTHSSYGHYQSSARRNEHITTHSHIGDEIKINNNPSLRSQNRYTPHSNSCWPEGDDKERKTGANSSRPPSQNVLDTCYGKIKMQPMALSKVTQET